MSRWGTALSVAKIGESGARSGCGSEPTTWSFPAAKRRASTGCDAPLELTDASILGTLGDDLGTSDPERWRMFSYEPDSVRYTDLSSGEELLTQGEGYWLITRDEILLDTAPEVGLTTPADSAFALPIQPGWNLVGNPFAFPIRWDSVAFETASQRLHAKAIRSGEDRDRTGSSSPQRLQVEAPVAWDGQQYIPGVEVLMPFEGYWVHLNGDVEGTLSVPPVAHAPLPLGRTYLSRPDRRSIDRIARLESRSSGVGRSCAVDGADRGFLMTQRYP
jgi:hypothetical protein